MILSEIDPRRRGRTSSSFPLAEERWDRGRREEQERSGRHSDICFSPAHEEHFHGVAGDNS